jgi:hypothetical protein
MQTIVLHIDAMGDYRKQIRELLPDLCEQIHGIIYETIMHKMTYVTVRDKHKYYKFCLKYVLPPI